MVYIVPKLSLYKDHNDTIRPITELIRGLIVNVIAQLEFELAYNDVAVECVLAPTPQNLIENE